MARFVLEQLSDFGDYTGNRDLKELLTVNSPDVRVSPDGRHIHVILRKPKVGLVTFDKCDRPQPGQKRLDLGLTRTVPVVDVLYLDQNRSSSRGGVSTVVVVVVVYENGKAEFWRFQECKPGWHLLQTSDLCNSPKARVVSVCTCPNLLVWCEERPPSESSPALGSSRNKLRYCVCRRDYEVMEEGAVTLTGVKIALHNNPKFNVISSGEYVHLLPDLRTKPQLSISKFLLSWCPRRDTFRVNTTCRSTPLKEGTLSAKESDFKKLVTDCLGYLSTLQPPEIYDLSPTGFGGLLLLLGTGWVCLLQKDGMLRRVYKLAENCTVKSGTHTSLCLYQDTAVLLLDQNLHLIDLNCGKEQEKIPPLKSGGLLFMNQGEKCAPHLLSETGLYVVRQGPDTRDLNSKMKLSGSGPVESIRPGAQLVEAVFEEACKYYQQRSLSSTQLTVDALKRGGRFQAPISLASIVRNYLSSGLRQKGPELSQNGEGGGGGMAGQDKLMCSLEAELKALVSLEEVKAGLVRGGVQEVEAVCESLVEKEVARLLSSTELEKEALLHLNSIFSVFPCQAWRAAQATLQLHHNGEACLSSGAPSGIWKTVLSPTSCTPVNLTNGEPKHKHGSKGNHVSGSKATPAGPTPPAALPVFELLCVSVHRFEPGWLPGFLELCQQQQGSAGLGLSLASTAWGRGAESGENNVPLYKRALSAVSKLNPDREQNQDLEVELLLVSGRPNAILQALRILMGRREWGRVTGVAQKFCRQSPLLNKEIFTTLLCEVAQHRDLDAYLDLLWTLCPDDVTVTTILNIVLKNLPAPKTHSSSSSFPISSSTPSSSSSSSSSPAPFADAHSSHLTVGLLKPLLRKVLQRETKPSQCYADILQSPTYPPPAPPRQPTERLRTGTDASKDSDLDDGARSESAEQPPVQTVRMALPANLL